MKSKIIRIIIHTFCLLLINSCHGMEREEDQTIQMNNTIEFEYMGKNCKEYYLNEYYELDDYCLRLQYFILNFNRKSGSTNNICMDEVLYDLSQKTSINSTASKGTFGVLYTSEASLISDINNWKNKLGCKDIRLSPELLN